MKKTVLGIVLLGLVSASSLMAQNRGWRHDRDWRRADRGRHDYYRDYRNRRGDRCDQREADIRHDEWELRRDMRHGDYAAAQREREELRWRFHNRHRDRRESWPESRDTRYDRYDRGYDWARQLSLAFR